MALIASLTGLRLLVVAPHPDDESLALGGLIQQAVRQHADITLVQVTNGDNNPWPQRYLEKRWRIGSKERHRWGCRRNDEMLEAMRCLGLGASTRRCLGWPDMGVTARLQAHGEESIARLIGILRDTAPDMVVLPSLTDSHPDHSASHVLMRLAMRHLPHVPTSYTYHVHGRRHGGGESLIVPLDDAMQTAKRHAVLAHHTQVATARRRLLAKVTATEILQALPPWDVDDAVPRIVAFPWRPLRTWHPWLQLTLAHPDGIHVWSWRDAPLNDHHRPTRWSLPSTIRRGPVYAKLEMRCTSPWIFDHWGWRDLTRPARARQADPAGSD